MRERIEFMKKMGSCMGMGGVHLTKMGSFIYDLVQESMKTFTDSVFQIQQGLMNSAEELAQLNERITNIESKLKLFENYMTNMEMPENHTEVKKNRGLAKNKLKLKEDESEGEIK